MARPPLIVVQVSFVYIRHYFSSSSSSSSSPDLVYIALQSTGVILQLRHFLKIFLWRPQKAASVRPNVLERKKKKNEKK